MPHRIIALGGFAASPYNFEFHVSRTARARYRFADSLFATDGNAIVADFAAARNFAHAMNRERDTARHPELAVKAADINAMGLIDEISHLAIEQYRRQHNSNLWTQAVAAIESAVSPRDLEIALLRFVEEFPPVAVYRGEIEAAEYLAATANREAALQELLMLWLSNANPAERPYLELFDDANLEATSPYFQVIAGLHDFLETQPRFVLTKN